MEAAQNSRGRFYRPELDVIRFLAFFLVFLFHFLPSTHDPRVSHMLRGFGPVYDAIGDACGFGLSLFFTLSAFLICELLLRERKDSGTVAVKQFYIRRILRIWPLYYLVLALGMVFELLPGSQPADIAGIGWFAIFMGAWYTANHAGMNNPIIPLWSISVEEQFYLFAPWVMKYFSRKSLFGFCVLIILIANSWLFYLGRVRAPHITVWFNSFVQFECFAGGILLCLWLRGGVPKISTWQRGALLMLGFGCWFFASYGLHTLFLRVGGGNPGSWPLIGGQALATLGCVLLLVAFLGVKTTLLPRWAIYLGRISYGLYVFHVFAIFLTDRLFIEFMASNLVVNSFKGPAFVLKFIISLGLTIVMAAISYRYFEAPFLRMKKRYAVIDSQPIAGAG